MFKNFSVMLAAGATAFALAAQAQEAPDELVRKNTQDVLSAIKADKDLAAGNQKKIERLAEEKILPYFNFARMTQLAVGRNWREASDAHTGVRLARAKPATRLHRVAHEVHDHTPHHLFVHCARHARRWALPLDDDVAQRQWLTVGTVAGDCRVIHVTELLGTVCQELTKVRRLRLRMG